MKYFALITGLIGIGYLLGFIKQSDKTYEWMSRDFTTALKGFSILTVVWAHSGAKLGVGGIQFVAGVGVSLFLICSGYGLEMSYQKNGLTAFWKKRFLNVCVPFWTVELIGLIASGKFSFKTYVLDFFFIKSATAYGWFMQYIVICYILFYVIKTIVRKLSLSPKHETMILFGVFLAWFIIDSVFFANPNMPFLRARQMLSFPIGMLIAKNTETAKKAISPNGYFLAIWGGYRHCVHGDYTV